MVTMHVHVHEEFTLGLHAAIINVDNDITRLVLNKSQE